MHETKTGVFLTFLKRKATSAAVSAGAVIIALQVILPTVFDLMTGMILLGLLWLTGRTNAPK